MYYITESLLVGNIHEARMVPPQVTALLWAAGDLRVTPPQGMPFAVIPLKEYAEADPIDLEAGVDWLDRRPPSDRVLICCRAGMGRSVSIAMAYLCCVKGMTYEEVLALVAERRPGATPLPNLEKTIEAVKRIREEKVGPE